MMGDQYQEFYRRANTSPAFSQYCTEVYGIDLTQDGFSDREELDHMVGLVPLRPGEAVLDIGCGNGKIDRYLGQTGAILLGIDASAEAVHHASMLASPTLSFQVGDLNDLSCLGRFDVILLIDSIYFSSDYERTLSELYDRLLPGGRLVLMYSEFLFDEAQQRRLTATETRVAAVAAARGWTLRSEDRTRHLFALMKRKRQASERHQAALEAEGNGWLFRKVHDESIDPAMGFEAFERFTNRFFYCIEKEGRG